MDKAELAELQFQLRLEKMEGIIKPFVLFAEGKMMNTDEAIEYIERVFAEKD